MQVLTLGLLVPMNLQFGFNPNFEVGYRHLQKRIKKIKTPAYPKFGYHQDGFEIFTLTFNSL
jgi:hypothetical protein